MTGPPPAHAATAPVGRAEEPLALPRARTAPDPLEVVPDRARRRALSRSLRPSLLLVDGSALLTALVLTVAVGAGDVDALDAGFPVATVLLLASAGLYRSRLTLSALQDAGRLVSRTIAAGALALAAGSLLRPSDSAPASEVLLTAALGAALLVLGRTAAYAVVRACRRRGLGAHRTVVVGAGHVGVNLTEAMLRHPEYGLRPMGFLDTNPLVAVEDLPTPLLGGDKDLARLITEHGVDVVVVAFGQMPASQLVEVLRTCDRLEAEIFFVPRLFELHAADHHMDRVWGIPLIRHGRAAFRSRSWKVKRVLDAVASALALVALAPLLAVLAAVVRLDGGPGVIFRQERVGLDGRVFEVLKFRTFAPSGDHDAATRWSIVDDSRLSRVGRLLRAWSLDELPQLYNVLRGDMSLVGPRPERPHFVDTFASSLPRYPARHRVPAGLTGWAQVHGLRGDTSISDRASFDNYYIENWSLGLDLRILLMTVASVVTRRGG